MVHQNDENSRGDHCPFVLCLRGEGAYRDRAAEETLRRRAAGDELWTYLFKAWECSFGPMADKAGDPAET